jgi:hypothetical protein
VNPQASGSTGPFGLFSLQTAAGDIIDEAEGGSPAGWDVVPGALGGVPDISLNSYIAGASNVEATLSFTLGDSYFPNDGVVVIQFPLGFDVSSVLSQPEDWSGVDGGFFCSGSGRILTIARSGDGSDLGSHASLSLVVKGLVNPLESGSTASFMGFKIEDGDSYVLADASLHGQLPGALAIEPAGYTGTNPSVVLSSYSVGAVNVTATLSFTPAVPLPVNGSIHLDFPSSFDVTEAGSAVVVSGFAGELNVTTQGSHSLVITVLAGGPSTGRVTVEIMGVSNPQYSGSFGPFPELGTYDGSGTALCLASLSFNDALLPAAPTILAADVRHAEATLGLSTLSAWTNVTFLFIFSSSVPEDGIIRVAFPEQYAGHVAVSSGDFVALDGLIPSETISVVSDGTEVTLRRSDGPVLPPGSAVSFTLVNIENPSQEGAFVFKSVALLTASESVVESLNDFASVDVIRPGVILSVASLGVTEGGSSAVYTIVLASQPGASVNVTLAWDDAQVSLSPAYAVFDPLNWWEPQSVVVAAVDDNEKEATALSVLQHAVVTSDPGFALGAQFDPAANILVRVYDNDFNAIDISESHIYLNEGESSTYAVVLKGQPSYDVVVTVLPGTADIFIISGSNLTFSPSSWNVAQEVVVMAVEDAEYRGDFSYYSFVNHTAASVDPFFTTGSVSFFPSPDIFFTIYDNDLSCHRSCDPGFSSTGWCGADDSTMCQPCEPGWVCEGNCTSPIPCAAGTASSEWGAVSLDDCEPCADGYFSQSSGSAQCEECPAGYECWDKSAAPEPCGPGSFSLLGWRECQDCTDGTYSELPASSSCETCPPGYECFNRTSTPAPCSPGSYSLGGGSSCLPCPEGYFCSSTGSAPQLCEEGSYSLSNWAYCGVSFIAIERNA